MKALRVGLILALGVGIVAAWTNRTYLYQKTVPPAERLRLAKERGWPRLQANLKRTGMTDRPAEIYLRAIKDQRILQLWASKTKGGKFDALVEYPIAAMSGGLGPKRKEGDKQVPEGLYTIDRFNPASGFWLSLGINYPNASDRILSDQQRPGGDIFIHGSNKSIGCLAMTDPIIEEIYMAATIARANGQRDIRVDIFPSFEPLKLTAPNAATKKLWTQLEGALDYFTKHGRPAPFRVGPDGAYNIGK